MERFSSRASAIGCSEHAGAIARTRRRHCWPATTLNSCSKTAPGKSSATRRKARCSSAGHKAGGKRERIERDLPKHHEIPFDSDRKRRTVIRRMPEGQLRAFINGAPDVLLARCTKIYTEAGCAALDERRPAAHSMQQNKRMAHAALRVLGSAYRDWTQSRQARMRSPRKWSANWSSSAWRACMTRRAPKRRRPSRRAAPPAFAW